MRNTIATAFRVEGVGVHCGTPVAASLSPAPAGHGLRINGTPATIDAVSGARFATTLTTIAGPVRTAEHLLAALYGLGVDDVDVVVDGGELPILDGSAAPWVERITLAPTGGQPDVLVLDHVVEVRDADSWAIARPAAALRLIVSVDFPGVGAQRFVGTRFAEYASARTFGYARDAQQLHAAGLALGASRANTLVLDDRGAPLDPLRFPDELARHKCLDLLGDLALLGARLQAEVEVHRGGHALHHTLVRALLRALARSQS